MGLLDTEKMKALREKLGLSQDDAAKRAELGSRQAWYNIESGTQPNVTLATLEKIAAALKTTPKNLLKHSRDRPSSPLRVSRSSPRGRWADPEQRPGTPKLQNFQTDTE